MLQLAATWLIRMSQRCPQNSSHIELITYNSTDSLSMIKHPGDGISTNVACDFQLSVPSPLNHWCIMDEAVRTDALKTFRGKCTNFIKPFDKQLTCFQIESFKLIKSKERVKKLSPHTRDGCKQLIWSKEVHNVRGTNLVPFSNIWLFIDFFWNLALRILANDCFEIQKKSN